MMELLTVEERRVHRGAPLCVCLVDIDHFKIVNDTHGHQCGDQVLREFVTSASSRLRPTDSLARYGGEEFFIGLPHTRRADAHAVAERVRHAIEDFGFSSLPPDHRLTVSVGVAEHRPSDSIGVTLARVDTALYEANAGAGTE